ncbi:hypothetical protein QTP70_026788, partial [Hemibagrus guttatus]
GAGENWATVGRRSRGGRRVHRQREKRKDKSLGLRIGTLNVGTMTEKGRELADMMERRKVDILCLQETRWKGSKALSIGAGFKLFYYGVDSKRNGVGVVLKEEFVRNVLEVKRVSDRVMSLKLEIEGVMLNVVSGYAPQVGCELEEKEKFWSELDEVMESIPTGERVVIGADFNGHVGEGNRGDEEVMGKFGVKERNLEGQMVVDFAKRMDMAVVNTYIQKREEHRVNYKSGGRRTQVDYILCRRGNLKEISDCKMVVGESVARQHRMVVCRMTLMVCKKKRSKLEIEKKTKWWKLKKEECCEEFRQKLRQALGGQVVLPDDWETTAEVIRETGRKVLGVSSGRRKEDKETWWWNEEVQDSIQRKRLAKKKWDMDRTEENRQEYKELQCRVKREVSKAKQKAYDELYTRLDTREGEKDLYRLARQRDRDGKDVQQVRVINDRDGRVLTSEESVQRRWKEYFEELMNEENEREKRVEWVNSVEQKVDKIRKDEVRKALKRMKSGKAVGPDDIPVEVWKCLGEAAVEFLTSLFNRVLESERMPEEWRRSVLVPIFKNKGDVQSCSNYRGIKLMSHTMKLFLFQTNDSASVWKGLKAITNYKPRAPHSVNDLRLANSLNEYYCRFERQWNSPDPTQSSPHQLSPTQLHTSATPHPPPLTPLTIKEEEVNRLFKRLNTRKATGPDSISPSLLKHCANQLSPVFTDIFNTSLETCHVPACFKTSAIVPVPKKTKITGLNDYRPVALTSVVMKSFERLVLSYLKDITDPLLDPLQFAYRANRSVDDAVNMALHFILQHLDSPGSYARILFVDFSSAFNTIIPALLRDKLFQLNVPDSMCSWITDFLTDRRQFVRLGTHVSDLQHISTGSPQSCVLSPLLFSLYTNGCTSGHQSVKLLKFADDTTLIGLISDGNESAYRGEIDRLVSWCSTNNLELNSLKTVEMTVDFRKDPAPRPPVILCDSPVSSAESFCFLGTTITKELKWAQNISYLTKKAQQRMYFLRQLKKFLLPVKMLVNFYTAIIESVLTSSITVWFAAATARDKAKLQRVIHSAEKVIGCSLPSLQELYFSRSRRRAAKIAADPSHPGNELFRVVEARLRKVVEICEQQYGFMPRKSTTDAIFALRILMEKYRDGQRELHCVFVDLETVYDSVKREELWYCMRKSGVAEKYVRVVQDMYERSRTVVSCAVGQTEEFKVEVGLHQGLALSPFLFAIVMDQLSEEVRQESPWTIMFADDIVMCSESREQVEENLERWRFALERRGMKVNRSKTEYMCVNEREGSGTVRLQGEEVKKVQEFKYLGSTVQSNGECGKE